jgi:non-heme chloroperoxidase
MDVDVDGCVLRVGITGDGPTVLLIHGTAAALWGEVIERLALDHRVVEYDRRSFGGSVAEPLADTRRHTRDAAVLLERLASGPAVVVGWSMGGVIALDLVCCRPELVSGVVVIEAPLFAKRRPRPDQVAGVIRAKLAAARGDSRAGATHFLNWALQRQGQKVSDLHRLPDPLREVVLANAAAIVREIDAGTGEAELTPSVLRGVNCPVRWLHGDSSAASFRTAARRAVRLLPNMTVVPVAGAGHMVQLDRPDAVVTAVGALPLAAR